MSPFGLAEEEWDRVASRESKNAIFAWLVAGLVYQVWWAGRLVSWTSLLLFMPGIFVASFVAGMPIAMVNAYKIRRLTEARDGARRVSPLELLGWTAWWLVELVFAGTLGVVAAQLGNRYLP